MLRTTSVFALAFLSGAASAQSLTQIVSGVLGTAGPTAAPLTAPLGAAVGGPLATFDTAAQPVTSAAPLPGLVPSKALLPIPANTLPVGANVLEDGDGNTGYDDVLRIGEDRILTYDDGAGDPVPSDGILDIYQVVLTELAGPEPLGTPDLINQNPPSGFGALKVAIFGGDNVGNAAFGAPGPTGGIGIALFSGNNAGNGTLGIGVGNGAVTGNGTAIGIAALSDNRNGNSGNGGSLGVGVLNQGDLLHVCGGGTCAGAGTVTGPAPDFVSPANPVLTGSILGPDNSGNGGAIAVSLFSGNNTGQGGLVGVAVGSGDDSARGPIAVGVLTGNDSVQTNDGASPVGGIAAVGVLTGNNSVKRQAGAPDSGAPFLGAGVLTGNNSVNDSAIGLTNASILGGPGSGGAPAAGPGPGVDPGANPDDNGEGAQRTGDTELCALLAKDNRGQVRGKLREKAHCAKLKTPRA